MIGNIKRIGLAMLVTLCAFSAFATQPGNNGGGNGGCGVGQQTNGCGTSSGGNATGGAASANAGAIGVGVGIGGAGGNSTAYGGSGGKGGEGGSSAVVGSGNSSVKNENANVGLNLQGQQQGQGQSQSNTSANSVTGYGGNATGNGAGNSTSVNFEGSTYKEAAQTAYAPTPSGPRSSCRIFIGFGGSSTSGSLSGGIPLANDGLCVAGAQVEFMQTVNKVAPGTFGVGDYLQAVCAVEGMDKMKACAK